MRTIDSKKDKKIGLGGLRCPCCRKRGMGTHETKQWVARRFRRASKQRSFESE